MPRKFKFTFLFEPLPETLKFNNNFHSDLHQSVFLTKATFQGHQKLDFPPDASLFIPSCHDRHSRVHFRLWFSIP